MKIVAGEPGEVAIRPSDHWADRAATVLGAGAWIGWGCAALLRTSFFEADSFATSPVPWLMLGAWLIVSAALCARVAWTFLGVTRVSVSADELVMTHCIARKPVAAPERIPLASIRDVSIEKREFRFKGNTVRRWVLVVRLDDGTKREPARFSSDAAADEFMARFAR